MRRARGALLVVGLGVVGLGAGAGRAWLETMRLRYEVQALREQNARVEAVRAENARLKSGQISRDELERLRADHAALPRLRAEIEALRQRIEASGR